MLVIFIVFWILLGVGVFFVAMSRAQGVARAGARTGPASRVPERVLTFAVALVILAGLAVPGLVLAFNGDHKAREGVGGVQLNNREVKGRELFAKACTVCHTLAAVRSVGRIGPNLDIRVGDDISTEAGRRALVLNAILEGRAIGLGNMPAELYVGKEAEDVADFVSAVAGH